jgi:hypothetical protein
LDKKEHFAGKFNAKVCAKRDPNFLATTELAVQAVAK